MGFVKISGPVPNPGELRQAGDYAVCNVGGVLYAVDNSCPHHGGPLGMGALHGHSITCPWHAWQFDCRTGKCDFNSSSVATHKVEVRNGELFIDA